MSPISPPMTIIEQALIPKNPAKKSEDGVVVTPDYIAVIDGSTSKATRRYSLFNSNGRYAMQIIARFVRKAGKDLTCHQFCSGVTRAIARHYRKSRLPYLADHPEERLTASCIVYSRLRREIWMIGDCQCMVGGTFYDNPKPTEEVNAKKRSAFIKDALTNGKTTEDFQTKDEGRLLILPDIIAGCQKQNVTYAVFDGFPVYKDGVRMIPCKDCKEIVLSSDGYPFLKNTLAESEQALKDLLTDDPLCIEKFFATKGLMKGNVSFDDRTYIRLRIGKESGRFGWLRRWIS